MPEQQNWWDIVEDLSGAASQIIYAVQGQPPAMAVPVTREPAVSLGLTGQSGLILIGLAIVAVVFFATRK